MIDIPPDSPISRLRHERGETLEQFGAVIGISSKSGVSELERGLRNPTPTVALAIERVSAGRIDAATLNKDVAASREAIGFGAAQDWHPNPAGIDDAAPEAFEVARVILCAVCERRTDDHAVRGCTAQDCPHSDRASTVERRAA